MVKNVGVVRPPTPLGARAFAASRHLGYGQLECPRVRRIALSDRYTGAANRRLRTPWVRTRASVSDRRTLGGLTQFLTQFGFAGSATGL